MDYEKKYNEALKRVRRLHDRMQVLSSTDALVASSELEFIFPELAESEDERIREWLVNYFKAAGKSWIHRDISPEQILAYLEKQKEKSEIPIMDGDTDTYFDDLRMTTKPLTSREWFEEGMKYAQRLQKEQKPAEYLDKDKVYAIMKKLTSLSFCVPLGSDEEKRIDEITRDVRSLLDYPIEQKQEWSEEDEKNCNRIIRFLEPHKTFFPTKETKEEMQNWLNNRLKDLRPQKLDASKLENFDPVEVLNRIKKEWPIAWEKVVGKPEWSEEDEEMLDIVLTMVDCSTVVPHSGGQLHPSESYKKDISEWLKSLRPSWKPSEEQMKALEAATVRYQSTGLESLYEELKKL